MRWLGAASKVVTKCAVHLWENHTLTLVWRFIKKKSHASPFSCAANHPGAVFLHLHIPTKGESISSWGFAFLIKQREDKYGKGSALEDYLGHNLICSKDSKLTAIRDNHVSFQSYNQNPRSFLKYRLNEKGTCLILWEHKCKKTHVGFINLNYSYPAFFCVDGSDQGPNRHCTWGYCDFHMDF